MVDIGIIGLLFLFLFFSFFFSSLFLVVAVGEKKSGSAREKTNTDNAFDNNMRVGGCAGGVTVCHSADRNHKNNILRRGSRTDSGMVIGNC